MSKINLLPCPFCGGKAMLMKYEKMLSGSHCMVECTNCSCASAKFKSKEEAIKAWNTRKPMEQIAELLEESLERYEDLEYYEQLENGHTLDFEYAHGKKDGINEAIQIIEEITKNTLIFFKKYLT